MMSNQTDVPGAKPISSSGGGGGGGRYLKNKRQRNRTLTFGLRDVFLPTSMSGGANTNNSSNNVNTANRKSNSSSVVEDSSSSSVGSDPGICLQFTGEDSSGGSNARSEEELSDADSLELNLKMFDLNKDEEPDAEDEDNDDDDDINISRETDISLAFVAESATVHSYIASRGQREKEEEIYEVLPARIAVRKKKTKPPQTRANAL